MKKIFVSPKAEIRKTMSNGIICTSSGLTPDIIIDTEHKGGFDSRTNTNSPQMEF